MLQQLLLWKTNKQVDSRYPAHMFYHTGCSSGRKDALKLDLRISDPEEQITAVCDAFVEANVKKGWLEVWKPPLAKDRTRLGRIARMVMSEKRGGKKGP